MIEYLPHWINWLFLFTVILTIIIFYFANGKPVKLTLLILIWGIIQSILAYNGFYENTEAMPPRFLLVLGPTTAAIILGFRQTPQNWMLQNRKIKWSTFLHTLRIPVEIVLFYLYLHQFIPQLMTFEGRNFDILAGISAPLIGILHLKKIIGRKTLLIWNILGLFMVLFILINGILSSKLPIQIFGFEQPNIAMNYFPFVLLPAIIVPLVIYTHLTDIIKLLKKS